MTKGGKRRAIKKRFAVSESAIYGSPKRTVFQRSAIASGNTCEHNGALRENKNGSDFHPVYKGSLWIARVARIIPDQAYNG